MPLRSALTYAAVIACGTAALFGMDAWCGHLMATSRTVRDFALTPAFGVAAIFGGVAVALAAFFALVHILLPRAAGRTASGEGE